MKMKIKKWNKNLYRMKKRFSFVKFKNDKMKTMLIT